MVLVEPYGGFKIRCTQHVLGCKALKCQGLPKDTLKKGPILYRASHIVLSCCPGERSSASSSQAPAVEPTSKAKAKAKAKGAAKAELQNPCPLQDGIDQTRSQA